MTAMGEVISSPLFLSVYFLLVILIIMFILGAKFALFGVAFFFKKLSGKYGLLFLKMADGNIKIPKFVQLDKKDITIKTKEGKKTYAFSRDEFMEGRMFGLPFAIKDYDDASSCYGLYCEQKDENGKTVMQTIESDGKIFETNYPVLSKFKGAYRVDPQVIDGIIAKKTLLSGMKDFLKKNQIILILLAVSLGLSLMALYVNYENYTMLIEQVIPQLKSIAAKGVETTIIPGG